MEAKLSQHQIGPMASDQPLRHHRGRPTRQAQQPEARAGLAQQHRQAIGQASRLVPRAFITEVGLHLERQPHQIGAHKGFRCRPAGGGKHQQPLQGHG